MKKLLQGILAVALIIGVLLEGQTAASAAGFRDIPNNHWAKHYIDYLVSRGVIQGYSDNTFRPNNQVTNAQVALMLVRALHLNTDGRPDPGLKDVYSTHQAYREIATAIDEGIFPNEGRFNPDSPISRASMARAISNAFDIRAIPEFTPWFWDVSPSHWAYNYVHALSSNRITTGYDDGAFKPNSSVTRGQFSAFVVRALKNGYGANNDGVIRGIKPGMNKAQVRQVETATLSEETADGLYYYDVTQFGYRRVNLEYTFDSSNRISTIFLHMPGLEHFSEEDMGIRFDAIVSGLVTHLGLADEIDETWYEEQDKLSLRASWNGPPTTFFSVNIRYNEENDAGIIVQFNY